MQDPALWKRIAEHPLDASRGTAPYSVKLAEAEGWTKGYTSKVIEEYRRFVYLTQISDDEMTPSEPVDRAWHMHLTFTRDYWDVFCPQVLGNALHHDPCAGDEEMPRYRAQFDRTKALYVREFRRKPPGAIWGAPAVWGAVAAGCLFAALGAILLVHATGSETSFTSLSVLAGLAFAIGGVVYAGYHLPQKAGPPRDKANTAGCGGSGCGGCGGCGG